VDDLHSRAATLLRRPCCFSKDEPRPTAVGLVQRYVDREPWADPELPNQLAQCIRYAESRAAQLPGTTGPARDACYFYKQIGDILREIQAEMLILPNSFSGPDTLT
jgi:hypothetical protein